MRHEAIRELYANAVTIDDAAGVFDEDGNPVSIDEEAVAAKEAELRAAQEALSYQWDRALAYPSVGEQLDMLYHDQLNGTTTWQDAIAAVKEAYPKGE